MPCSMSRATLRLTPHKSMLVNVTRGFNAMSYGWLTFSLSKHACNVRRLGPTAGIKTVQGRSVRNPHCRYLAEQILHGGERGLRRDGERSTGLIGTFSQLPAIGGHSVANCFECCIGGRTRTGDRQAGACVEPWPASTFQETAIRLGLGSLGPSDNEGLGGATRPFPACVTVHSNSAACSAVGVGMGEIVSSCVICNSQSLCASSQWGA